MSRRVYIHVGAPKTGTTYLQDRLALNRKELAKHDVHYPLQSGKTAAHFHAALDLLGMRGGYEDTTGAWDALVKQVNRLEGTVVISHEILASARPERVRQAVDAFAGSEVHVVYSARDLGRQIPAGWQEGLKNSKAWSYQGFLRKVRTSSRTHPDWWFWRVQSLPDVLSRWSAGLPPDRVHLVTVPPRGAPKDLLWHRFCQAFGIDPSWAPEDSERGNPSMGTAESAVVRRLNRRMRSSGVEKKQRVTLVKELLVHQNLAGRADTPRVTLPPRLGGWAQGVAQEWVDWVEGSGIDVVGDVSDLRVVPHAPDDSWSNPDRPKRVDMVDAAIEGLTVMTLEAARRGSPDRQLTAKISRATRRLRGR